jgi:hypothetical protein
LHLHFSLESWQAVVLLLQIFSLIWILDTIWFNTGSAQQHIKAHLLVIQNDGFAPTTTPIYQKHLLYRVFLYVIGLWLGTFLIMNLLLAALNAANWVISLVNNMVQFVNLSVHVLVSAAWKGYPQTYATGSGGGGTAAGRGSARGP